MPFVSGSVQRGFPELEHLHRLQEFAEDGSFHEELKTIKRANKEYLAKFIRGCAGIKVCPDSIFDVHIKRFHLYKRQLLNAIHISVVVLEVQG